MGLVEECYDLVSGLERFDQRTDSFDSACAVGTRDDVILGWERILALEEKSDFRR